MLGAGELQNPNFITNQRFGYPVYINILSKTEYELEIDEEYNIKKRMKFGEPFVTEDFNFTVKLRDKKNFSPENLSSGKYYFIFNSLNSLTSRYRSKLGVVVTDKESSILTLSTQGYVAQQEVDYLNKLMEVFIRSDLDEKNQTAVNTIKIIDKSDIENLYIATSGPIPPNPAELLEKPSMKDFLYKAKKEFDYVILDTPPVAIVTDAILLTQFTDTNIFIVRQKYSSKNVVQYIDELFNKKNIKNLSLLVNDVKIQSYYGYGYGYSYGYGQGYYGDEDKTSKSIYAKIRKVLFGKKSG